MKTRIYAAPAVKGLKRLELSKSFTLISYISYISDSDQSDVKRMDQRAYNTGCGESWSAQNQNIFVLTFNPLTAGAEFIRVFA